MTHSLSSLLLDLCSLASSPPSLLSEHHGRQHRYGRTEHLGEQIVRNRVAAVATDESHSKENGTVRQRGGLGEDVFVPGGQYLLGGVRSQPWVFDAERYAHPVMVEPFEISKAPVTNAE